MKNEDFIARANKKHDGKYEYGNFVYVRGHDKSFITCLDHGDFSQSASKHLSGRGCPACAVDKRVDSKRGRLSNFIKKAKAAHGDFYDYSLSEYITAKTKVKIKCPLHGEFEQTPANHQSGQGCPKCRYLKSAASRKVTMANGGASKPEPKKSKLELFVEKAKSVHGDQYDYSKVAYEGCYKKVSIICKQHGLFKQTVNTHLNGCGCPECAKIGSSIKRKSTTEEFIAKSISIHGDIYDYSKVEYTGNKNKVTIICPTHGEFEQIPNSHLGGNGCIKCSSTGPSKAELEILELVHSVYPDAISSDRTAIAPYELDIYIPELGLAIEYNGTHWHSEKFRERKYHQNKYKHCKAKGISLFQIWEHDWLDANKRKVIMSMLSVKLGLAHRVFGRKCQVNEIDFRVAKKFYNENHLQGAGQCHSNQVHYALFNNDEILMCMSVDLNKNYLTRLCSKLNTVVVGGARKLQSMLPAGEYMTYALNDLGGKLGHYKEPSVSITEPRYFWHKSGDCIPRQRVQKHKLAALYPEYDGSTERAWMESIGYSRVFDSGNTKIIFNLD